MTETYVIHTTKKCNLDCFYCYEEDKTSEYTIEEIKENIDNLFKNNLDNIVHIEFLGGEPLYDFNLLMKTYEYLNSKYSKFINNYTITSNGTLVTDKVINFLKQNKKIGIAISMDGTKYSNQLRFFKNGKNSYDKVVENIALLKKNNIDVSIHIVTHPFNVSLMFDNIKHIYHDLGISGIGIGTIESTIEIDEVYCNEFKKQIEKISDYIIGNKLPIYIDLFGGIKPKGDVRTYVRDKTTNKLVFESYGRIENSIFNNNERYEIQKCNESNEISEMIYSIREYAYMYHTRGDKMSLLNTGKSSLENISDCVGKVGNCSYVTNPKTNNLYKNIFIDNTSSFDKLEEDEEKYIKNNQLKSEELRLATDDKCDCGENCNCEDREDTIALALSEILKMLEKINNKLDK